MSTAAIHSHQGDDYQVAVAKYWVINLLTDSNIEWLEVEAVTLPGETELVDIDDIVVSYLGGGNRFIQAKKNQKDFIAWSIPDLKLELKKASKQWLATPKATIEFYSRTPFELLQKTCDQVRIYCHDAFFKHATDQLQNALNQVAQYAQISTQQAHTMLLRFEFGSAHNTDGWKQHHRILLDRRVTDVEIALEVIEAVVRQSQSKQGIRGAFGKARVIQELEKRGVSYFDTALVFSDDNIREQFALASRDLLSWPTTLPGNHWLERAEVATLVDQVRSKEKSLTLVLGPPGCGKSALLARVAEVLQEQEILLLAIKADLTNVVDRKALNIHLNLPADIVACVRKLASTQKVVVLIDQLDALAELVVLHTSRLRVILDLIQQLSDHANVHVVASCRSFERRHSLQLKHITDTNEITLDLPAWDAVAEVLSARGISTNAWNASMREDLRSPHALCLFLEMVQETDASGLLHGYQAMLEKLWKLKVLSDSTGARRQLLIRLAEAMAEAERLWLPRSRYEQHTQILDQLVGAGILADDPNRIGFRHQTMFEFVRAKIFVEIPGGLSNTVIAKQNSLKVRPQLWHALAYMRVADRSSYWEELKKLWHADLRKHLKQLLIDFLGQLADPDSNEAALFFSNFEDEWFQPRILAAATGNHAWFERMKAHYLPMAMALPQNAAWKSVWLLREAIIFAQDDVRSLVAQQWLPFPDRDELIWALLQNFKIWTPIDIDWLCRIVGRTQFNAASVNGFASMISTQAPDLAPRLIGAYLVAEWQRLSAIKVVAGVASTQYASDSPKKALLNSNGHNAFYDLVAIAEAAPESFLHEIWPWFIDAINEISDPVHPFVVVYRSCHLMYDDFDASDSRLENHIVSAFVSAIDGIADTHPEKMVLFAKQNSHHELMLVHRLIARGLARSAAVTAAFGAKYLAADARRLVLGNHRDAHGESAALIAAVSIYLSNEQMLDLEQSIVRFRYYQHLPDDGAQSKKDRIKWDRGHRRHLLNAFPRNRLTAHTRRLLDEEMRANLGSGFSSRSTGIYRVESPVSTKQMQRAKEKDILNLFAQLTSPARQYRSGPKSGGVREAGQALQEMAKAEPARAIGLAREFKAQSDAVPVGNILCGLSESGIEASKIFALIGELVGRGFSGLKFRRNASWAIQKCVSSEAPLPENLFLTLEKWLEENPVHLPLKDGNEAKEHEGKHAILFGFGAFNILPDGNYPILLALSAGCMRSESPQSSRWLEILTRHAIRPESPEVWASMSRDMAFLEMIERKPAEAFIGSLLSMHAGILNYRDGVHMIAIARRWAGSDAIRSWLETILAHPSAIARQGAGELLVIQHIIETANNWTGELLDAQIADQTAHSTQVGIAFAAAEFWHEPRYRKSIQSILIKLLASEQVLVLNALSGIFFERELPPDLATYEMLECLMDRPAAMQHLNRENLCEALLTVIDAKPELVGALATILLFQSIQNSDAESIGYSIEETFVTIALKLQELGGVHSLCGAAMFEQLLEINSVAARVVTNDLDKRTKNSVSDGWTPHKRRRRVRKSKSPVSV